jgi:hypothetical protein
MAERERGGKRGRQHSEEPSAMDDPAGAAAAGAAAAGAAGAGPEAPAQQRGRDQGAAGRGAGKQARVDADAGAERQGRDQGAGEQRGEDAEPAAAAPDALPGDCIVYVSAAVYLAPWRAPRARSVSPPLHACSPRAAPPRRAPLPLQSAPPRAPHARARARAPPPPPP